MRSGIGGWGQAESAHNGDGVRAATVGLICEGSLERLSRVGALPSRAFARCDASPPAQRKLGTNLVLREEGRTTSFVRRFVIFCVL